MKSDGIEEIFGEAGESKISTKAGNIFRKELRCAIKGEVRFDTSSRVLSASVGFNYRRVQVGVAIPRFIDDVVAAVAICRKYDVPLFNHGADVPIVVQHTRLDSRQAENGLLSTIAFSME